MVNGSDSNTVGVLRFVVEDSVALQLVVLDGEKSVIGSTCSIYKPIGKGVSLVGVNGVESTNSCTNGLILVNGVVG